MKMTRFKTLIVTLMAMLLSPALLSARASWQSVAPERVADVKSISRTADVEIKAARGVIVITANRPVQVKVFSILGQSISQESLPAGTHRLSLPQHGIFIVKVGDITCKVAL